MVKKSVLFLLFSSSLVSATSFQEVLNDQDSKNIIVGSCIAACAGVGACAIANIWYLYAEKYAYSLLQQHQHTYADLLHEIETIGLEKAIENHIAKIESVRENGIYKYYPLAHFQYNLENHISQLEWWLCFAKIDVYNQMNTLINNLKKIHVFIDKHPEFIKQVRATHPVLYAVQEMRRYINSSSQLIRQPAVIFVRDSTKQN